MLKATLKVDVVTKIYNKARMTTQGERLKEIREYLRLSQAKIASSLDIAAPSIGKAEKNINRLSNESLKKLVINYNVNINWLLTGEGEMFVSYDKIPKNDLDKKIEQKIAEAMKNIQK